MHILPILCHCFPLFVNLSIWSFVFAFLLFLFRPFHNVLLLYKNYSIRVLFCWRCYFKTRPLRMTAYLPLNEIRSCHLPHQHATWQSEIIYSRWRRKCKCTMKMSTTKGHRWVPQESQLSTTGIPIEYHTNPNWVPQEFQLSNTRISTE